MKTTLTKEREIAVACLFFLSWDGCPAALGSHRFRHKKRASNLATTNPLRRKPSLIARAVPVELEDVRLLLPLV